MQDGAILPARYNFLAWSRSFFGVLSHIINPLSTKHEFKMDGYWPRSFFACSWAEKINMQKKNLANIQPS